MLLINPSVYADECASQSKNIARKQAQQHYRAGRVDAAIIQLQAVGKRCVTDESILDYWLRSDLGLYLYKAKRYDKCVELLAGLTHPSKRFAQDNDAEVNKAIDYNFTRCRQALLSDVQPLKNTPCPSALSKEMNDALRLPSSLSAQNNLTCIGWRPSSNPPEGEHSCPQLWRISQTKAGDKLHQQQLEVAISEGQSQDLIDTSYCCNLSGLRLVQLAGEPLLELTGSGRDCYGGTANTEFHLLYRLNGKVLERVREQTINYH